MHSDCNTVSCPAHSLACQRQQGRHLDALGSPGLPACRGPVRNALHQCFAPRLAPPCIGVRTRVRIQKEAGILKRGMAALRSGIASLLGLSSQPKPEDKVYSQHSWPQQNHTSLVTARG